MQRLLSQLRKVLRVEAGLYRVLLETVRAERDAMARAGHAAMQSAAVRKAKLLARIEVQEKRRSEVIGRLAARLNRPVAGLSLDWLAGQDQAHGAPLRQLRSELLGLLAQVREEHRRSEMICRHASEVVRGSLRMLQGLASSGTTYRPNGRMEGGRPGGRILCGEL